LSHAVRSELTDNDFTRTSSRLPRLRWLDALDALDATNAGECRRICRVPV